MWLWLFRFLKPEISIQERQIQVSVCVFSVRAAVNFPGYWVICSEISAFGSGEKAKVADTRKARKSHSLLWNCSSIVTQVCQWEVGCSSVLSEPSVWWEAELGPYNRDWNYTHGVDLYLKNMNLSALSSILGELCFILKINHFQLGLISLIYTAAYRSHHQRQSGFNLF